MSFKDPMTRGEQDDRQRELKALESIAASLALPQLVAANRVTRGRDEEDERLDAKIKQAQYRIGMAWRGYAA